MSDGRAVDADAVGEIIRTTPPPKGFEPFAVAIGAIAAGSGQVFGQALDPFKPADIVNAPGSSTGAPPHCPNCHSLIQPIVQNAQGDTLFECLFDGYETVFRIGAQVWEPRPQREAATWRPPVFGEAPATSTSGPVARGNRPETDASSAAVSPSAASVQAEMAAPPPVRQPMAPRRAPMPVANSGDMEWLTLQEAAAVSGLLVDKVYALVRGGAVSQKRGKGQVSLVNMDELFRAKDRPDG